MADQHNYKTQLMQRDGWTFGAEYDEQKKIHPCLVPYDELSPVLKLEDQIVCYLIQALSNDYH